MVNHERCTMWGGQCLPIDNMCPGYCPKIMEIRNKQEKLKEEMKNKKDKK
jgi:hypothetical protein